ncbi:MAG: RNA-binding S4 domain-containing protein [Bacteroidetes bacterium]|nr:RNA-binding S4 domain-containing protein [Bacteroidota bacterium]
METRADTYLWAIRMYKSRTLAGDAIKGGKVKLNGSNFKPSHAVKIGEIYTMSIGDTKKIIEVVSLIDKRGSYEIAKQHYIDKTEPKIKSEKLPSAFFKVNIKRDKGEGRPTKKDRRDLSDFGWGE